MNLITNFIGVLFGTFKYLITIILALSLLCCYLSLNIAPSKVWWLSLFSLGAPVIIFANIITALYWVIRWRGIALLPILMLLFGYSSITSYYNIRPLKDTPHSDKGVVTLASYNVMCFNNVAGNQYAHEHNMPGSTIDSIASFVKDANVGIFAIQEMLSVPNVNQSDISSAIGFKYSCVRYIRPEGDSLGAALAVYSKYPIIASKVISDNRIMNGVMYADIIVRSDTLRIFNCHLQTNNIDKNDIEFISKELKGMDSTAINKGRTLMYKVRENNIAREQQVDSVRMIIDQSPYPSIICGDFNDVPSSYTYKKMRGHYKDSFKESGRGYGYTFNRFLNMLRIDYIFVSPNIDVISYNSPKLPYSDHNPVVAEIKIKSK